MSNVKDVLFVNDFIFYFHYSLLITHSSLYSDSFCFYMQNQHNHEMEVGNIQKVIRNPSETCCGILTFSGLCWRSLE